MDDVLMYGRNKDEHNNRLTKVLQRIQNARLTLKLNKEKREFNRDKLVFLGHVIDKHGISPDPSKTKAIMEIGKPKITIKLRRFLGMANQMGKFHHTWPLCQSHSMIC